MAQQLRDTQTGAERTHAAVVRLLIHPGSEAVTQAVVCHGAGRVLILNLGSHFIDVLLESDDGDIGGHAVRDKQLVPSRRDSQQLFQFNGNTFVDGNGANFATLSFNSDGVFPEGLFCDGRVDAEALFYR